MIIGVLIVLILLSLLGFVFKAGELLIVLLGKGIGFFITGLWKLLILIFVLYALASVL